MKAIEKLVLYFNIIISIGTYYFQIYIRVFLIGVFLLVHVYVNLYLNFILKFPYKWLISQSLINQFFYFQGAEN